MGSEVSEEYRSLWIRTILALAGSEPQRRAFIEGYNGMPPPSHSSTQMLRNHALAQDVRAILAEKPLRTTPEIGREE
jgi:hypothetical protein